MNVDLIFITCNRLSYTKLALASLLADPNKDFSLTIWDNVSTDGTREYLDSVKDPRIKEKVFASKNAYLTGAANQIFRKSTADLLAIIPDDFLLEPGWIDRLAAVHADVPQAGLISSWFLGKEFFDEERAKHKIQRFGQHRILRHPWTGGGAALFKRKAWAEVGGFNGDATPDCWKRMAARGYINGFLVPPVYVEHMDDPWSPYYCGHASEFRKQCGLLTDAQVREFHLAVVKEIIEGPWDVKWYLGWRAKLRRLKKKLSRSFLSPVKARSFPETVKLQANVKNKAYDK